MIVKTCLQQVCDFWRIKHILFYFKFLKLTNESFEMNQPFEFSKIVTRHVAHSQNHE